MGYSCEGCPVGCTLGLLLRLMMRMMMATMLSCYIELGRKIHDATHTVPNINIVHIYVIALQSRLQVLDIVNDMLQDLNPRHFLVLWDGGYELLQFLVAIVHGEITRCRRRGFFPMHYPVLLLLMFTAKCPVQRMCCGGWHPGAHVCRIWNRFHDDMLLTAKVPNEESSEGIYSQIQDMVW